MSNKGDMTQIGEVCVKKIISLCDFSGAWSQPYVDAGEYEVIRIDLQRDGRDVRLLERMDGVHGILAAPPCTCFAASGARWKRSDQDMIEALSVVDACIRLAWACKPKWWALENPIGKLSRYLGQPRFRFNPCDFGDPYTKRTCLWGDFTPPTPQMLGSDWSVPPTEGSKMHTRYGGKSLRTKNARSETPKGFAKAFFTVNP